MPSPVVDLTQLEGLGDYSVNRSPREVRVISRQNCGNVPLTQQRVMRLQRTGDNPHIFTARVRPSDKKVEVGWVTTPNEWWKIKE